MRIEKLKKGMKERGIGVAMLAEITERSERTIRSRLSGKTLFTSDEIRNIAVAMGLTAAEILDIFFCSESSVKETKGHTKEREEMKI